MFGLSMVGSSLLLLAGLLTTVAFLERTHFVNAWPPLTGWCLFFGSFLLVMETIYRSRVLPLVLALLLAFSGTGLIAWYGWNLNSTWSVVYPYRLALLFLPLFFTVVSIGCAVYLRIFRIGLRPADRFNG